MDRTAKVTIYNVPKTAERYIVARCSNGELWYWGSWEDLTDAQTIADEVDGLVVELDE
jgi:streptogramin lyase